MKTEYPEGMIIRRKNSDGNEEIWFLNQETIDAINTPLEEYTEYKI